MTPRQVKTLRTKLGLLQRELAVRLGVSTRTVQGWENGRRPHGSAAKLMKEMEAKAAVSGLQAKLKETDSGIPL